MRPETLPSLRCIKVVSESELNWNGYSIPFFNKVEVSRVRRVARKQPDRQTTCGPVQKAERTFAMLCNWPTAKSVDEG